MQHLVRVSSLRGRCSSIVCVRVTIALCGYLRTITPGGLSLEAIARGVSTQQPLLLNGATACTLTWKRCFHRDAFRASSVSISLLIWRPAAEPFLTDGVFRQDALPVPSSEEGTERRLPTLKSLCAHDRFKGASCATVCRTARQSDRASPLSWTRISSLSALFDDCSQREIPKTRLHLEIR